MAKNSLSTQKQQVYDYVYAMLGGGMVDVELDPVHYETALTRAFAKYRQKGDNSVQESYIFLDLIEDQNTYTLPTEVIEVNKIFRRSIGSRSNSGGSSLYEPFNMAFTNAYLLSGSTNMGGLATYELFAGYQELVGKMFGSFIEFNWNPATKQLTILQRPRGEERIMMMAYNYRPDSELLIDYKAGQWLKEYTLANCKYMLGEARSKFATIAGPQGGTSLNGDALKAEAQQEIEKLENDLMLAAAGGSGYAFLIG